MKDIDGYEKAYQNGFAEGIKHAAQKNILRGERDFYICSDSTRFWDYESALNHEIEYLRK